MGETQSEESWDGGSPAAHSPAREEDSSEEKCSGAQVFE